MFTFQAWRPAAQIGDPVGVAAAFSRVYNEHRPNGQDDAEIRFEIVDLRTGAYSAQQVHDFVKRLARLLLGDPADAQSFSPASRLLFVGSVRTLATREREADDERSIKRDAEFYIRALQNYDLAHYAGIGEDGIDLEEAGASILSALIGISRHYRDRERCPAKLRLASRLARIRSDFVNLVSSARNLPEFQFLGSTDGLESADRVDHLALLLEIGIIYQFGKGDRPEAFSPGNALVALRRLGLSTFDVDVEDSSYKLYAGMLAKMGSWAEAFHAGAAARDEQSKDTFAERQGEAAGEVAKRSFKLSRYDLLRDFGRVIGQGTLQRLREIGPSRPILLIDDEVHGILAEQGGVRRALDDSGQDPIIRYLGHALGSVGRSPVSVHVVPSDYIDAHMGLMQATGLSRLLRPGDEVLVLDLEGGRTELCASLDDYLAILIDPESRRDPCGPVRVQRLNAFLRHRFGPVPGAAPIKGARQPLPPLLAYSRKESSGYVQQCLNMGASAFVSKTRPYQLLFALSRALRDERRQHRPGEHAS